MAGNAIMTGRADSREFRQSGLRATPTGRHPRQLRNPQNAGEARREPRTSRDDPTPVPGNRIAPVKPWEAVVKELRKCWISGGHVGIYTWVPIPTATG